MFDHLLESSHRDDSNKWLNIGFGEEITQLESIEINVKHLSGALNMHLTMTLTFEPLCVKFPIFRKSV